MHAIQMHLNYITGNKNFNFEHIFCAIKHTIHSFGVYVLYILWFENLLLWKFVIRFSIIDMEWCDKECSVIRLCCFSFQLIAAELWKCLSNQRHFEFHRKYQSPKQNKNIIIGKKQNICISFECFIECYIQLITESIFQWNVWDFTFLRWNTARFFHLVCYFRRKEK